MAYTGLQRTLVTKATEYTKIGYKVGYSKGKSFLAEYKPPPMVAGWYGIMVPQGEPETPDGFDGISIIPEGIVCVDLDINDFGVIWMGALPVTWKERTPRGWHLFYNIHPDIRDKVTPKIKWQPHVDLLVRPGKSVIDAHRGTIKKRRAAYSNPTPEDNGEWSEHVLVSPTPGYTRVWPTPEQECLWKTGLADAPVWLNDALAKP